MKDLTTRSIAVSVEIAIGELMSGKSEINGYLRYVDGNILFSYRTKNLVSVASDEKQVNIPLADLQQIDFKSSIISTRLTLHPKKLTLMDEMPGAKRDRMVFNVKWADRHHANTLASLLRAELADIQAVGEDSVPFQLEETNMGLTEHSGLIYLEDEFLVFEIQSGVSGMPKGESKIIKIEWKALEDIRYVQSNLLKDHLYVKPKKADLLAVIPGSHDFEVKLKVSRKHRLRAEMLVGKVLQLLYRNKE